jgi:hypothetical protein
LRALPVLRATAPQLPEAHDQDIVQATEPAMTGQLVTAGA